MCWPGGSVRLLTEGIALEWSQFAARKHPQTRAYTSGGEYAKLNFEFLLSIVVKYTILGFFELVGRGFLLLGGWGYDS